MNRRTYSIIAAIIAVAILALLGYSLDRTAWAFRTFEGSQPLAAGLGLAAALVVELAIIGLIAGRALADALRLDDEARRVLLRWGRAGMIAAILAQTTINLVAGGLRGWRVLYDQLAGAGLGAQAALAISGLVWLLVNALVPFLLYVLSEMEARIIRLALTARAGTVSGREHQLEQIVRERAHEIANLEQECARLLMGVEHWQMLYQDACVQREQATAECERLRAEREHPRLITKHDIVSAWESLSAVSSGRAAAERMGIPEATLIKWREQVVSRNGHM